MMHKEETYWIWMGKQLTGELSPQEATAFEAWLAEDDTHSQLWQDVQQIWQQTAKLPQAPQFDTEAAWEKVEPQLSKAVVLQLVPERKQVRRRIFQVAAAVLLLLTCAFSFWMLNPTEVSQVSVMAEASPKTDIQLPDGSMITLNQHSTLSYPEKFASDSRQLKLEGQAFFEVARDEERPFQIQVGEGMVEVLGTSFDVRSYGENELRVRVKTGKVRVSKGEEAIVLEKGEEGWYDAKQNALRQRNMTTDNYLSWQTQEFQFSQTPLSIVAQDLSEFYGESIQLASPKLDSLKLNARFRNQPLDSILVSFRYSLGLQYERKDSVVILRRE